VEEAAEEPPQAAADQSAVELFNLVRALMLITPCPTCGEPWAECCEHVERWCIVHEHDPITETE